MLSTIEESSPQKVLWNWFDWFFASCYDWFQDKNSVTRCQNVVKTIKNSIKKKKKRRKGQLTASSSVHPPPPASSPTNTVSSTTVPPTEKLKSHIDDLRKFLRQFLKKSFSMTDLQMKPYRTDEYVHKLFYETTRFSAFNHQWIVKAIINNSQRDVHQTNDRQITYQVMTRVARGRPCIMSRLSQNGIDHRMRRNTWMIPTMASDASLLMTWTSHTGHIEIQDPISVGHSLLRSAWSVLGHEGQHEDLQTRFHWQREWKRFQRVTFAWCRWSEPIAGC